MQACGVSALARRVGARLRAARLARGLTQRAAAKAAGIAAPYLCQIESGQRQATVATLARVARVAGISLVVAFRGV